MMIVFRHDGQRYKQFAEFKGGRLVPTDDAIPVVEGPRPKPTRQRWDGKPWPLRIRLRCPIYVKRYPGCGCIKPLKRLWNRIRGHGNGSIRQQRK